MVPMLGTVPWNAPAVPTPVTQPGSAPTEKSGTRIGMVDETARRRLIVEDLELKAGLSVRMISSVTDIPRSSVHRAKPRAIARAEAKKEVAIAEIAAESFWAGDGPTAAEGDDDQEAQARYDEGLKSGLPIGRRLTHETR